MRALINSKTTFIFSSVVRCLSQKFRTPIEMAQSVKTTIKEMNRFIYIFLPKWITQSFGKLPIQYAIKRACPSIIFS